MLTDFDWQKLQNNFEREINLILKSMLTEFCCQENREKMVPQYPRLFSFYLMSLDRNENSKIVGSLL